MPLDLRRELEVACTAARAAGAELLRFFGAQLDVQRKEHAEPVTEADRASEAVILPALRQAFPDYGILSEEQSDQCSWRQRRVAWLVDPMDGTRDFIAHREGFAVMIGLLVDLQPVLGVIFQPTTGVLYRAAAGCGPAEMVVGPAAEPLAPSGQTELNQSRLVTSMSYRNPRIETIKRALGITDELRLGSLGLKASLVARGDRDLYLNLEGHGKLWDACAPQAILTRAGGRFTDIHGDPIRYDDPGQLRLTRGVLASNAALHRPAVAALRSLLADDSDSTG